MPDSEDPKQVSNDLRNAQFGGGLINAGTVNAGQIGGDIHNIHLGQQTAVSGHSVQSQNQRQRSQQERDSLEKAYTLQSQKIANLRTALVIETDVTRKFQYEHQLQSEERTLKELGDKLDAIEQQLQATDDYGVEARKNYIEQLIAYLKTEIESLENQIGWTLNDVDKNKLQRQLDDKFDEIEKAESELNQLNQQPRQVQQLKINSSDLRKNYIEQLIAHLKTEIESLGNQIGWTLNDVDKNKLQRQLDDKFDEIEKAESELNQLNQLSL